MLRKVALKNIAEFLESNSFENLSTGICEIKWNQNAFVARVAEFLASRIPIRGKLYARE